MAAAGAAGCLDGAQVPGSEGEEGAGALESALAGGTLKGGGRDTEALEEAKERIRGEEGGGEAMEMDGAMGRGAGQTDGQSRIARSKLPATAVGCTAGAVERGAHSGNGQGVATYPAQLSQGEQEEQESLLSAAVLSAQLYIQKRVKISFGVSVCWNTDLTSVSLGARLGHFLFLCLEPSSSLWL